MAPETPCELQGLLFASPALSLPQDNRNCIEPGMHQELSPGGSRSGFLGGPGVMSQEGRNGDRMKICIPRLSVPVAPMSAGST